MVHNFLGGWLIAFVDNGEGNTPDYQKITLPAGGSVTKNQTEIVIMVKPRLHRNMIGQGHILEPFNSPDAGSYDSQWIMRNIQVR